MDMRLHLNLDSESKRALYMAELLDAKPLEVGDVEGVSALIMQGMMLYEQRQILLTAARDRLDYLYSYYRQEGFQLYVIKNASSQEPVACAGIGSFRGLPLTEKIGEIRDLVVAEEFRGRGLGKALIQRCLEFSDRVGYARIYLETTPAMMPARQLFEKTGFRPVKHLPSGKGGFDDSGDIPSYYVLERK